MSSGGYHPSTPSPYAYIPVDPFKPSLAFSLKRIFGDGTVQDVEAGTISLHEPPPKPKSRPRILRSEIPSHKQVREGREVHPRWDILPEASSTASMAPSTRRSSPHAQPTVEPGRHREPRSPSPPMRLDSPTHFLYSARTEPRQWAGRLGLRVGRADDFLMTETKQKQEGLPGVASQDQPPTSLPQPQYNAGHDDEAQPRLASPDDSFEMRGRLRDGFLTSSVEDVDNGVVADQLESSDSANPATAQVEETASTNVPSPQYLCDNGGHECVLVPRSAPAPPRAASFLFTPTPFEADPTQQGAALLANHTASSIADPSSDSEPPVVLDENFQSNHRAPRDFLRPFLQKHYLNERLPPNEEPNKEVDNAVSVDPIPKTTTIAAYREHFHHTTSSSLSSVSDYTPIAPPSVRRGNALGLSRARSQKVVSVSSSPFRTDSVLDTKPKLPSTQAYIIAFLFDTVPRQIYLHMLLRLPHLYFARVTRIFEEAEMSMPMIKQGILDTARAKAELTSGAALGENNMDNTLGISGRKNLPMEYWEPRLDNAAYRNLQNTWQAFIDALQKEWKTLNIISVLLLTAILTILQIPSAAADPLTRYSALLSMICALMSLLYGCLYIIRFGTMRKTYKGAEWAQEAQKSRTSIFWNVWVLLAMPATWLAWSMILYVVAIMSFVWRTTPVSQPNAIDESSAQILVPRVVISFVVGLGIVYLCLIAATLRKYGEMMDRAWQLRIWGWMQDEVSEDVDKDGQVREIDSSYNGKNIVNKDVHIPADLATKHSTDGSGVFKKVADQGPKDIESRSREFLAANAIDPEETADTTLRPLAFPQVEVLPGIAEPRPPSYSNPPQKACNPLHDPKTSRPRLSNSDKQRVQPSDVKPVNPQNCVRLFGLLEAMESSFSNASAPDAVGLLNITAEEWDAFKQDVIRNTPILGLKSAALTNHSALAKVLQDFNGKLRMRGCGGSIFVRREFPELGNSYILYFVPDSEAFDADDELGLGGDVP